MKETGRALPGLGSLEKDTARTRKRVMEKPPLYPDIRNAHREMRDLLDRLNRTAITLAASSGQAKEGCSPEP